MADDSGDLELRAFVAVPKRSEPGAPALNTEILD